MSNNTPDYEDNLVFPLRHDKTAYELQAENNNLRALLKECGKIIKNDLWEVVVYPNGEEVKKEQILTRINAAIGESEE